MYGASAGYDYVVFHFGAGPAGSPGGWWQAFYLGGLEGSFSVPTIGGRSVGGFSSARFCNAVPEIGSTALLLGTGLFVVGIANRRFATR
jgi:VPDSG-CTERM motif